MFKHYGKPVYLLIDEYDTPLNQAYMEGYFKPMVGFLRSLFGAALKGNNALKQGIITGVLRLAEENLFSGLNNLKANTVLKDGYSQYYGFTEKETANLFEHNAADIEDIKHWYNGYQCHEAVIYNPWSIINCLDNQGELRPYWVNTVDNSFIRKLLLEAHPFVQPQIVPC